MKKKIFSGVFALVLLAVAGYGVSMRHGVNLSDLMLSDVEALADSETACLSRSGGKNTGVCKERADGGGDACVKGYFWEINDCYTDQDV